MSARETVSPLNFANREPWAEARASLENPTVSLRDPAAFRQFFGLDWGSKAGPLVNVQTALGVPAFWCGVNVLAGLFATLPFHEFERTTEGRSRVQSGPNSVAGMLAGTVNDDFLTCYDWRFGRMVSLLTTGAGRTWVERDKAKRPINLWPLETERTTKFIRGGRTGFRYRVSDGRTVEYDVADVIDFVWMYQNDGLSLFNPIERLRDTLGLGIALEQYASKFFANGGVPPLALKGKVGSPQATARAKADINEVVREANRAGDQVVVVPPDYELSPIGFDPEKGQLVEAQRFVVEQIARLLNLPPVMLHDLSKGTFSNTEQQDLALTKHGLQPRVARFEAQCNAKFYGPRQTRRYVEMNLDALQRGDFTSRMNGLAKAVQTAILMPDEARELENRPAAEGGNRLYIQGATVPLVDAGKVTPKAPPPAADPAADPADEPPADAPPADA